MTKIKAEKIIDVTTEVITKIIGEAIGLFALKIKMHEHEAYRDNELLANLLLEDCIDQRLQVEGINKPEESPQTSKERLHTALRVKPRKVTARKHKRV